MAKVHVGTTLTPHFREFLPRWVARQRWYRGTGVPELSPVGFFRFEDPAGEVGIETHLVTDGAELYQIPMTYRGEPLAGAAPEALIVTAEHSVLGTRWIYDGKPIRCGVSGCWTSFVPTVLPSRAVGSAIRPKRAVRRWCRRRRRCGWSCRVC
ncbi:hypothetical protein SAMN04489726_2394 [Allokutzneria albata]|uniref:Maltokinase N-terminal cap domain-containing protein n=1 Tax=Allokutzneria albata TaxID=211114 RepID=A0A1G9UHC7_ALLAB|nr:hypothetical protein SAMN04489726_2394 [Allokutzneria albata]